MSEKVLDPQEMRILRGGLKLVKQSMGLFPPLSPLLKRKVNDLEFMLVGAKVTVEYDDGGYK